MLGLMVHEQLGEVIAAPGEEGALSPWARARRGMNGVESTPTPAARRERLNARRPSFPALTAARWSMTSMAWHSFAKWQVIPGPAPGAGATGEDGCRQGLD